MSLFGSSTSTPTAASLGDPMTIVETVRSAKRKRNHVSYDLDEAYNGMGLDDSQEDDSIEADAMSIDDNECEDNAWPRKNRKPKRPRLSTTPRQSTKPSKPFPFLSLPPELRDMIYEHALRQEPGVQIIEQTRHYRRTVRWGNNPLSLSGDARPKALTPALLAVSKQLHAEAAPYLYAKLEFADAQALHHFISAAGSHASRMRDVTLHEWGHGRGTMHAANFSAFASMALAGCTNLIRLRLPGNVCASRGGVGLARLLFRNCCYFFEAFGRAHGKPDAVVDILELPSYSPVWHCWPPRQTFPSEEEDHLAFGEEMRKLLTGV